MSSQIGTLAFIGYIVLSVLLFSCSDTEDPGPLQEAEKNYSIVDFDRLEMGDALIIEVRRGNFYSVSVRGDRRNIDDLDVYKDGNTLVVRYDENTGRKHDTYVSVTMPELRSANFSGATNSTISGFTIDEEFNFYLSGASVSQVDIESPHINVTLSGASNLSLVGSGHELTAEISGASEFNAYRFEASEIEINVSGASYARVVAIDKLIASATGASVITYRGNPELVVSSSGFSTVVKD